MPALQLAALPHIHFLYSDPPNEKILCEKKPRTGPSALDIPNNWSPPDSIANIIAYIITDVGPPEHEVVISLIPTKSFYLVVRLFPVAGNHFTIVQKKLWASWHALHVLCCLLLFSLIGTTINSICLLKDMLCSVRKAVHIVPTGDTTRRSRHSLWNKLSAKNIMQDIRLLLDILWLQFRQKPFQQMPRIAVPWEHNFICKFINQQAHNQLLPS